MVVIGGGGGGCGGEVGEEAGGRAFLAEQGGSEGVVVIRCLVFAGGVGRVSSGIVRGGGGA